MPALRTFPMPRNHPRILHRKGRGTIGYLLGDSLSAIAIAARRRIWGVDQNGTCDADGQLWINHWPKFRKGGWRWIWNGKRDRKGREIRVPVPDSWPTSIEQLHTHQAELLRSRKRGGRRLLKGRVHMASAAAHDVHWCLEAKGSRAFRLRKTWDRIVADAIATKVLMVVMTLTSLPGWKERLEAAHAAGIRNLAVLPRGRKPEWFDEWAAELGVKVWNRSGVWK